MILYYMIVTLHFIVCVALIVIVLLQAGKGGGMAGLFGGGGSDQIFSAPSGMAFIKKVTVACAIVFAVTSLTLTLMSSRISMQSVVSQVSNIPIAAPQQPSK
ncbi:MAG: preprotein translocase subunit SecG [Elusimicrobia bacterium]|nr:preprotein translocase subunit SecG [Elusimicrobiota bacterium]